MSGSNVSGELPNITFHAVPSWYWQPSPAWQPGVRYTEGQLVHRSGLEFDRHVCLQDHLSDSSNAPRDSETRFWRIEYEERVPLNAGFVDSGVYLSARDEDSGDVTDISNRVRRHGLVNTNKVGHYVLTYYCDYLGVSWEGVKRKVVVYEPEWLQDTVPQIFMQYPAFRQTLQNYLDLYYELNYLSDNVRLGLGVSHVTCDKYTKHWAEPKGEVADYRDGFFWVKGYTFKDGDKVLLSQTPEDPGSWSEYYIQSVATEKPWRVEGSQEAAENGYYEEDEWVRFLDKNYVCEERHLITQDANKIKPRVMYPVVKKMDKEGGVIALQSKYWVPGCRVTLVKYERENYRRVIQWDEGELHAGDIVGAAMRRFRPIVDAQGFLFEYDYELRPYDRSSYIVIQEVGGDWGGVLGPGWDSEADPEKMIWEDGGREEAVLEKKR